MAAAQVPRAPAPVLILALAVLASLVPACGADASSWDERGVRRTEGRLDASGRRDGPWLAWYANGQLRERGTYESGRRVGTWTQWHPNGQRASEGERRWDGSTRASLREGPWRFWFQNGVLRGEGRYAAGAPVGPWRWWTHTGAIDAGRTGTYDDGVKREVEAGGAPGGE